MERFRVSVPRGWYKAFQRHFDELWKQIIPNEVLHNTELFCQCNIIRDSLYVTPHLYDFPGQLFYPKPLRIQNCIPA